MKRQTIFYCLSYTEAKDSSNLYYISAPTATGIEHDQSQREIKVTNRNGGTLAIFYY